MKCQVDLFSGEQNHKGRGTQAPLPFVKIVKEQSQFSRSLTTSTEDFESFVALYVQEFAYRFVTKTRSCRIS
jgi:hypothetical protein